MKVEVNISQLAGLLTTCLKAKKVPMIHGSPGIGKSSIVKDIARRGKLKLIDVRLSQLEPSDLLGYPFISADKKTSGYAPMGTFPIEGRDTLPEGYAGYLLFLDEFSSASKAVQVAAYRLILDREVGNAELHKKVHIIAAGNLASDKAVVTKTSTATQSRLLHLELVSNFSCWFDWACAKGKIHQEVLEYLESFPDKLNVFNPNHDEHTFPCERTWEFVSHILNVLKHAVSYEDLPLIAGCIGQATAYDFIAYINVKSGVPKLADIINDQTKVSVPGDPSTCLAITRMLQYAVLEAGDEDDSELVYKPVFAYLTRLPVEFQVTCVKSILHRNRNLITLPDMQKLFGVLGDLLK